MGTLPVMMLWGLSFPPAFCVLLAALPLFWLLRRLLLACGVYQWIWHPALFNCALYAGLFYCVSGLFI